jgi:hypothetical protein
VLQAGDKQGMGYLASGIRRGCLLFCDVRKQNSDNLYWSCNDRNSLYPSSRKTTASAVVFHYELGYRDSKDERCEWLFLMPRTSEVRAGACYERQRITSGRRILKHCAPGIRRPCEADYEQSKIICPQGVLVM